MKNIKQFSLLVCAITAFTTMQCSENINYNVTVDGTEAMEFPSHATTKYLYNKTVSTLVPSELMTRLFGRKPDQTVTTDTTSTHYFTTGITRTKITATTENNVTTYVTETWTSRDTRLSNSTILALAAGAAVTGLSGAALLNDYNQSLHDENHPHRQGWLNAINNSYIPNWVKYNLKTDAEQSYPKFKTTFGGLFNTDEKTAERKFADQIILAEAATIPAPATDANSQAVATATPENVNNNNSTSTIALNGTKIVVTSGTATIQGPNFTTTINTDNGQATTATK